MKSNGRMLEPGWGGSLALLLSVYLLILAFFVLLNSMSSVEQIKARAGLESLSTTFADTLAMDRPLLSDDRELEAARVFLDKVGAVVQAAIPAAKVKVVLPGRLMHVTIPVLALFQEDTAALRPGRQDLADRIAAALAAPPPGAIYQCEILMGTGAAADFPAVQTLETARAGSLARLLLARGAPPAALAIGLERGSPDEVHLLFRVEAVTRAEGE